RLDHNAADMLVHTLGLIEGTPERTTVVLPPPVHSPKPDGPSYAFLIHPTRPEDVTLTNPGLRLTQPELGGFCDFLSGLPAAVALRAPPVRSATGKVANGLLISLPLLPAEMARRGVKEVSKLIAQAVDLAAYCGATVVGLGGHTTAFSRRGLAVVGRGP